MSEENVEIVRECFEAVRRGDFANAVTHFATDVVYTVSHEVPVRGPDAVRALWQRWEDTWEQIEMRHEEFLDAGENVVVTTHEVGQGRASGIEVDQRVFNVFTVRDGKIVRKMEFMDRTKALEAAGLSE
jgi:ketosteroid isomerase-like protein